MRHPVAQFFSFFFSSFNYNFLVMIINHISTP